MRCAVVPDPEGRILGCFIFIRHESAAQGVRVSVVRLPVVHAARLYRLAIEKGSSAARYHAVADEAIAFRDIAEIIGRGLNVPVAAKSPEEAVDHFGWFAAFAGGDGPASSKLTRERLGWHPVQPSLLADLERGSYFKV